MSPSTRLEATRDEGLLLLHYIQSQVPVVEACTQQVVSRTVIDTGIYGCMDECMHVWTDEFLR